MKYAIIIPDGAADEPLPQLDGKTPLEAADIPNMDRIAAEGHSGLVRTIPEGFESGSDVAIMCLLGYAPAKYHSGRAPLEAAAQRIPLSPTDWVFRCNLVTVIDGIMKDHSAGGITNAEARSADQRPGRGDGEGAPGIRVPLRRELSQSAGLSRPAGIRRHHHAASRNPRGAGRRSICPTARAARCCGGSWTSSARLFADHPVNVERRKKNLRTADQVWLWGQGHAPTMPKFAEQFNVAPGAAISSVDLLRGLAVLLGWDIVDVAGHDQLSRHELSRPGRGDGRRMDKYDIVFSHVEAPDEASHQADYKTKIASIEHIDRYIVGPVLAEAAVFPAVAHPGHPRPPDARRHAQARLRPDGLRDGRQRREVDQLRQILREDGEDWRHIHRARRGADGLFPARRGMRLTRRPSSNPAEPTSPPVAMWFAGMRSPHRRCPPQTEAQRQSRG